MQKMRDCGIFCSLLLVSISVLAFAHTLLAQSYYKATTLTSSGGTSVDLGINDSGMVTGVCPSTSGGSQPCIWSPSGAAQGLGNLGGPNGAGYAINSLGQVAGSSTNAGNTQILPFLWTSAGGMKNLGGLGSGFENEALAINDSAQVVGVSCLDSQDSVCRAFLWTQSGGMQDLGTLGGNFSEATGINAAGHITGWSTLADGTGHAFLWTAETGMQQIEPTDTFPSYAWAINDSDQVAGEFNDPQDNNESHGFLWSQANGLQDLGTLGSGWSEALAINDSGDVVGFARTGNADKTGYAVIWKNGGAIQELATLVNPKDSVLLPAAATGINSAGQIAANGSRPSYLLTPRTQTTLTSSPNPSSEGAPVTFTAVVSAYLNPPPNGATVTFKKGATVLGTGTLSGGSASFTTSTLKVGTTTVTAVYGGDANFVGSTSAAVKQVVNAP